MRSILILVVVLKLVTGKFPPDFKKCSSKDPNFKTCIFEAAQDGISKLNKPYPEYKIPNADPLEIQELTIFPGDKGPVTLEQKLKNCKVYGISKLKFLEYEIDLAKRETIGEAIIPDLKLKCDYELDGKVLVFPVQGKGVCTIDLDNIKLSILLPWEEIKRKDGLTTMKFSTKKFSLDPEKIEFNFENLFNGDKTLGDNINKVLNENWALVWSEVRESYEKAIGFICTELGNDFFLTITKEDAFD